MATALTRVVSAMAGPFRCFDRRQTLLLKAPRQLRVEIVEQRLDRLRRRRQIALDSPLDLVVDVADERLLVSEGHWNEADEKELIGDIDDAIEEAVERYLATPPQPVEAMFDYLYAELPRSLREQRQAAIEAASGGGHD